MWPFSKKPRFPGVIENEDGSIEFSLTDEEARKADLALEALKGVLVHPDAAEKIRNGMIAVALSHYANELISEGWFDLPEKEFKVKWPMIKSSLEKAVAAVWKSYSLYPLPIFLYQRAIFCQLLGMKAESLRYFSLFIEKQSKFEVDELDVKLLAFEGTEIDQALAVARRNLADV